MSEPFRSLALRVARAGAVVLALAACTTLVVREHQRANPDRPILDGADPAVGSGTQQPPADPLLRSSKSMAIGDLAPVTEDEDPVLLPSSKWGAFTVLDADGRPVTPSLPELELGHLSGTGITAVPLHVEGIGLPVGPESGDPTPRFLSSSKSMVIEGDELADEVPLFLFGSKSAPLDLLEEDVTPVADPVFLPSSKVLSPTHLLPPALPAVSTPSAPVNPGAGSRGDATPEPGRSESAPSDATRSDADRATPQGPTDDAPDEDRATPNEPTTSTSGHPAQSPARQTLRNTRPSATPHQER